MQNAKCKKDYEILEHSSDLKIKAYGNNPEEVFANILKGMFESCQPEIEGQESVVRDIQIKSENLESLLVDFLSEIIYLSDVYNESYALYESIISNNELKGKLQGRKIKRLSREIKAITWHDLKIEKGDNCWEATVLFDI